MENFGNTIRRRRLKLADHDKRYSLRQVSQRIGIQPSYLSKLERGISTPLSEEKIIALARELDFDPDYLLALGGKISTDVQEIIKSRPELFSTLVREMKHLPDQAIGWDSEFKGIMAALDSLHDIALLGAFRITDNQEHSFWTAQIPAILGLPEDALPSEENALSTLSPEEKTRLKQAVDKAKRHEQPLRTELAIQRPDGSTRNIAIWGYCQTEPSGDAVIGIMQDVTESVQLRQELEAARRSLEKEMTAQVRSSKNAVKGLETETAIRKQLQEELSQLNRETDRRAAIREQSFRETAFQIRTIANQIVTRTSPELAARDGLGDLLARLLQKVDNLGDLLGPSKEFMRRNVVFDVDTMMEAIPASFEQMLESTGKSVNYSRDPNLPKRLRGDGERIQRAASAVFELLLQLTQWGSFQMSVRLSAGDQPALAVTFFTPSAVGAITKEDFYPSRRECRLLKLANPAKNVGPLVENLGGSVGVSAASETEITVRLEWPVEVPNDSSEDTEADDPRRPLRLLVVEGDQDSRSFIGKALRQAGHHVTETATGHEGQEALDNDVFDAILLDMGLPDMGPTHLVTALRQSPSSANCSTPILSITANSAPEYHCRYKEAGVNSILVKPFELDVLLSRLQTLTAGTVSSPRA